MPELSNIQTYEKLTGSDFRPALNKFCNVLKNIGLWNEEVRSAFADFTWEVEENGCIYSSITQLNYFKPNISSVRIRPFLMVYTPAVHTMFNENWISIDLLINAEDLRSFENGKFYTHTYSLVKTLASELQKGFKQTGVYFTDEFQDGTDVEGILTKNTNKIWQFDYALIPDTLGSLYSVIPRTHRVKRHDAYFEAWHVDRWQENIST